MLNKKNTNKPQGDRGKSAPKPNTNQKKNKLKLENQKKPTGNYTQFSSKLFRGIEYMERFILEVKSDKYAFKCMKCKDNSNKLEKFYR